MTNFKTTKIGNVIFYRVEDRVWLTHDGKYGIMRFFLSGKKKDCIIMENDRPCSIEDDAIGFQHGFILYPTDYVRYPNVREAMKAVCEKYYNEEVK